MLEKIKTGFVKARLDLVVRVVNKKIPMDNEVLLAVLFIFAILKFVSSDCSRSSHPYNHKAHPSMLA